MKKIIILLVFALSSNIFFAQDATDHMTTSNQITEVDNRDRSIKGTRYVNKKYKIGRLNDSKNNILFRFDAFSNVVEITADEKSSYYWTKKLGNKISFLNKSYMVFKDEESSDLTFYLTNNNNCKEKCFLVKEEITLSEETVPQNGYEKFKPATFSKAKEKYYISFDGINAVKIPKKKKLFYSFFGDQKNSIKEFMKRNKLSRKKKKDLLKVISFYRTL